MDGGYLNLLEDSEGLVWQSYLHKSNAADERIANRLSGGRISP